MVNPIGSHALNDKWMCKDHGISECSSNELGGDHFHCILGNIEPYKTEVDGMDPSKQRNSGEPPLTVEVGLPPRPKMTPSSKEKNQK
jgi:hypothetical protein